MDVRLFPYMEIGYPGRVTNVSSPFCPTPFLSSLQVYLPLEKPEIIKRDDLAHCYSHKKSSFIGVLVAKATCSQCMDKSSMDEAWMKCKRLFMDRC